MSSYTRVNLRGMGWQALLAEGPAALWSLVALTGDGATPEAVKAARDAIDARESSPAGSGPISSRCCGSSPRPRP